MRIAHAEPERDGRITNVRAHFQSALIRPAYARLDSAARECAGRCDLLPAAAAVARTRNGSTISWSRIARSPCATVPAFGPSSTSTVPMSSPPIPASDRNGRTVHPSVTRSLLVPATPPHVAVMVASPDVTPVTSTVYFVSVPSGEICATRGSLDVHSSAVHGPNWPPAAVPNERTRSVRPTRSGSDALLRSALTNTERNTETDTCAAPVTPEHVARTAAPPAAFAARRPPASTDATAGSVVSHTA